MLDAAAIGQGVVTGIATQHAMKATESTVNRITGKQEEPSSTGILLQMLDRLEAIALALSPSENPNIDLPMALQPYPYEYASDMAQYGKPHLSIFFHDSTPIRADIAGVGTYLKTVGPGWVSCDLWATTRFSTTDATNHNVIVSYRTEPIGSAL